MNKVLILAAMAAISLACTRAEEEEMGAAPEQGDTTAVTHVIDSARTGPPGVGGRPGDATITTDSVGVDSALTDDVVPDTLWAGDTIPEWTSTPQDTLGPQDTGMEDTSTTMQGDTAVMHGDSAMTEHPVPDTTTAQ
ncbi:MAG TPA: hypothetical protein VJ808_11530 [Gemmatimonadales bacterium]|nr:hypothetical protein [Gemmatimonadales bacterium]